MSVVERNTTEPSFDSLDTEYQFAEFSDFSLDMLGGFGTDEKYANVDFSFDANDLQVAPQSPPDNESVSNASLSIDSEEDFDDDESVIATTKTQTSLVTKTKTSKKIARNHPNRNALMAKMNRERKKAYVSELEEKLRGLEEKCKKLEKETTHQKNSLAKANAHIQMLQLTMKNSATLKPVFDALAGVGVGFASTTTNHTRNTAHAAGQHDVIPLQLNILVGRK